MKTARQGQFAGLGAAVLLYAGASLALLTVRLVRGTRAETPICREGWPALAATSSLLLNLEAVFTLAIAVLLGREHLGRSGLLSAALTIAGAAVLSQASPLNRRLRYRSLNRPDLPSSSTTSPACISALDLAEQLGSRSVTVIDVREPMEYASGHITGSLNVPLARLYQAGQPQGPLPLMRQVEIAAGSLLLLLVLILSNLVAPAWILLTWFVAFCGMARLLAAPD